MKFERESMGSNSKSTATTTSTTDPSSSSVQNQSPHRWNNTNSPQQNGSFFAPRNQRDKCYQCQNLGHWAKDRPQRSPKRPEPSPRAVHSSQDLPIVQCPCGLGICIVRISKTEKNPNRKFYSCPGYSVDSRCNFFKWCDMVRSDEISDAPMCGCGAGICRLSTETSGPNAGRKFFACPIKRGQGACSFFQWQETNNHVNESVSSPESTLTSCHDTSPSNSDLVEQGDSSQQGIEIESPAVDPLECPQKLEANSTSSRKDKALLAEFKRPEETSDEPCQRHCKRLRHGEPKIDGSVFDCGTQCPDMPQTKSGDPMMEKALQASLMTSEAQICRRQAEFRRQISIAGSTLPGAYSTYSYSCSSTSSTISVPLKQTCLVTDDIHQILGLHVRGWLGRLAFPPSRCLTVPAPKPFFCCVFPTFDPIFVPRDVNRFDGEASTIIPQSPSAAERPDSNKLSLLARPFDVLWESSGLKSPQIVLGNIISGSILEAFGQAAVRVQNDLLTLLESMDPCDHESMVREANTTFAALKHLSVDYQPFYERVKEFTCHASLLAGIERSIHNDLSSQELVDRYNHEKLRFDNISCVHAEATDALKKSNERLRLLQEEASRVKKLLFQIETKLSCCEAENVDLGNRLVQISKDMSESEQSFLVASKEAREALKLRQEREVERIVARARFDRAKFKLRP